MRSLHGATTAVPIYVCAIGAMELVTLFFGALPGLCGDCLLLFTLLNHYLLADPSSSVDGDARSWPACALLVLALAPLLRILSLVMPLQEIPPIYWYAFIGAPLLVAALLTARHLGLSFASLGFSSPRWSPQIAIAASGLPLGLIVFFLVRPEPLTPSFQWRELAIGTVMLTIFVGFTEEFLFRALLLQVAPRRWGRPRVLRRPMGRGAIAAQQETREQVRAFLPHVDVAPREATIEATGQTATLRWYDAARDTEVAVEADPISGVPRRVTERIRASGSVLTVTYDAWNTAVAITPP